MNYIKQIRFFWDKARRHSLNPSDIAMYFYLLEVSNTHDWENPVQEPNTTLQRAIGIKSFSTLIQVRNRLKQLGVIQFQTRNGDAVVEYSIYDVEQKKFPQTSPKNKEVAVEVPVEGAVEVPAEVSAEVAAEVANSVLLYNKPKQKLKQKQIIPPPSIQILEPEEIKRRLLEDEYELQQFICLQYQFSAKNFSAAVQLFVGEKTAGSNELHKPYPEVLKQFKAWVAYHRVKLLKQFNEKGTTTGIVPVWRQQY